MFVHAGTITSTSALKYDIINRDRQTNIFIPAGDSKSDHIHLNAVRCDTELSHSITSFAFASQDGEKRIPEAVEEISREERTSTSFICSSNHQVNLPFRKRDVP